MVLRPVRTSDLEAFYQHQADPVASALAEFPPRDRDRFMEHWNVILANPDVHVRAVDIGGSPKGYVTAFRRHDQWEVAYWLGREAWGRGIGTKALSAFLEDFPYRPLFGSVACSNAPSLHVLQKCGFEEQDRRQGGDGVEEVVLRLGWGKLDGAGRQAVIEGKTMPPNSDRHAGRATE